MRLVSLGGTYLSFDINRPKTITEFQAFFNKKRDGDRTSLSSFTFAARSSVYARVLGMLTWCIGAAAYTSACSLSVLSHCSLFRPREKSSTSV